MQKAYLTDKALKMLPQYLGRELYFCHPHKTYKGIWWICIVGNSSMASFSLKHFKNKPNKRLKEQMK